MGATYAATPRHKAGAADRMGWKRFVGSEIMAHSGKSLFSWDLFAQETESFGSLLISAEIFGILRIVAAPLSHACDVSHM
mmetsp:Transcript_64450/g.54675  ORF Transcript_64450/g.54675 Transcript_64450/m.54675 type:complete len:80 (+) Transcript_64450:116-355(+)